MCGSLLRPHLSQPDQKVSFNALSSDGAKWSNPRGSLQTRVSSKWKSTARCGLRLRSRPARDHRDRASICREAQGLKSHAEPDLTRDLRVSEVRSGGVDTRDAPSLLSWAQVGEAVDREPPFVLAATSGGFDSVCGRTALGKLRRTEIVLRVMSAQAFSLTGM